MTGRGAGLLAGRRLLVTGVLTEASIAFSVARVAQEQGAEVVLSSFGRSHRLTERVAGRLPEKAPVVELDVTSDDDLAALPERLRAHVDGLDGLVHAIGYAPPAALGGGFLEVGWPDAAVTLQVSTWSFVALARSCLPLLTPGSSILGLDFDARQAWPSYDWMGVAKAGLEACARYVAREVGPAGVRANLVAAGPLRTLAAKSVPGFGEVEESWAARAPLGWDVRDAEPVARSCVALLSSWFPATTGEVVHVDGGAHAMGG